MTRILPLLMLGLTIAGGWQGLTPGLPARAGEAELSLPGNNRPAANLEQFLNQATPPLITNKRIITVIGQGQASAPAEMARLEMRFTNANPFGSGESSLPEPPALKPEVLQPVVAALEKLGVKRTAIAVQAVTTNSLEMQILVEQPTRPQLQQIVMTADNTARRLPGIFLQGTGVQYLVRNCQPLERMARGAALQDARDRALSLATLLNLQIGDILAVTELPILGSPSAFTMCGSKAGTPLGPTTGVTPTYDPAAPTEVTLRSSISMTYEISDRPANGSRR